MGAGDDPSVATPPPGPSLKGRGDFAAPSPLEGEGRGEGWVKYSNVAPRGISLAEAVRVWARVALLSFGGPAGQIAVMHRILVDERRWVSDARFLHALNYCMLLPGPEAQQLATYLGWLLHRTRGGLIAGLLFVLPGAVALMALSWIYVIWGEAGVVGGLFFGLKAAVLAVVCQAVLRIGRRALRSRTAVAVAVLAFVALFAARVPFPLVVLAAAGLGYCAYRLGVPVGAATGHAGEVGDDETLDQAPPTLARALCVVSIWVPLWLGPVVLLRVLLGEANTYSRLAVFFSKVAVVTFGGAYAVLAYVAQRAVDTYQWLRPDEMLAGLGLAETTPGPLIMVVQYVGFLAGFRDPGGLSPLLAGTLAGLLVTWVTFAPCFLWVFLGAPYVETLRGAHGLNAALAAVTAAVVGVIANLAVWFAIHALFRQTFMWRAGPIGIDVPVPASLDLASAVLACAALLAIFRFRLGVIPTLLGCALGGVAWRVAGG